MTIDAKLPTQAAKQGLLSQRTAVLRLASCIIGAGFVGATFGQGIGAAIGVAAGLIFGILAVKNKPSQ